MNKTYKAIIKLHILSGSANPSPPIGPALGQYGVNIMDFCKQFNNRTSSLEKNLPIPIILTIYSDKSFDFIVKTPVTTALLKKFTSITKGSNKPGKHNVGVITKKQIEEIAIIKQKDMSGKNLFNIMQTIMGTAKSMGLLIKD